MNFRFSLAQSSIGKFLSKKEQLKNIERFQDVCKKKEAVFIYIPICIYIYIYLYLSICLSIDQLIYLSIYLSIDESIDLSIYLSTKILKSNLVI